MQLASASVDYSSAFQARMLRTMSGKERRVARRYERRVRRLEFAAYPRLAKTTPLVFWSKVKFGSGCWLWLGTTEGGYGRTRFEGRLWLAHRLAWLFTFGGIPDLEICHTCDNPTCVRPTHLFSGTHADNMRDMSVKGRCADTHGVNNPNVKLTEVAVRQVRSLLEAKRSLVEIARVYRVTPQAIGLIKRGKLWKDAA